LMICIFLLPRQGNGDQTPDQTHLINMVLIFCHVLFSEVFLSACFKRLDNNGDGPPPPPLNSLILTDRCLHDP
jgi:hypothetical protein